MPDVNKRKCKPGKGKCLGKDRAAKRIELLSAVLLAGSLLGPLSVKADTWYGWEEAEGGRYWYEEGVRQGLEGRGKEIYDPASDAWYWLDADAQGRMAADKDVYQESEAGPYSDHNGVGKWCRYDSNGHMVKGWDVTEAGAYYFDPVYGAMLKGSHKIDGVEYYFDENTGIMQSCSIGFGNQWITMDGKDYWYESGIRQGYRVEDPNYRGKEIYDQASDAWYWLDNVQQGAKAVDKDVYQESQADETGTIGKWVRYDAEGRMKKGWVTDGNGTCYFDPVYGTMAKGKVTIDGREYWFNETTGIQEKEPEKPEEPVRVALSRLYTKRTEETRYYGNHHDDFYDYEYEFNDDRNLVKTTIRRYYDPRYNETSPSTTVSYLLYEYDEDGFLIKASCTDSDGSGQYTIEYEYDDEKNLEKAVQKKPDGSEISSYGYTYDEEGHLLREEYADSDTSSSKEYTYDERGAVIKAAEHYADSYDYSVIYDSEGKPIQAFREALANSLLDSYEEKYEYDRKGKLTKQVKYYEGGRTEQEEYSYTHEGDLAYYSDVVYKGDGSIYSAYKFSYKYEYEYDGDGKILKEKQNDEKGFLIRETLYDDKQNRIEFSQYEDNGKSRPRHETYAYTYEEMRVQKNRDKLPYAEYLWDFGDFE